MNDYGQAERFGQKTMDAWTVQTPPKGEIKDIRTVKVNNIMTITWIDTNVTDGYMYIGVDTTNLDNNSMYDTVIRPMSLRHNWTTEMIEDVTKQINGIDWKEKN